MKAKSVAAFAALIALGACASPKPVVHNESPAGAALSQAMRSVKQKEVNRCFAPQEKGDGLVVYDVVKQTQPEKVCSLIFMKNGRGGFEAALRGSFTEGMSAEDCDLKALSCIRPAAARKIAARHGMTVDRTPSAR